MCFGDYGYLYDSEPLKPSISQIEIYFVGNGIESFKSIKMDNDEKCQNQISKVKESSSSNPLRTRNDRVKWTHYHTDLIYSPDAESGIQLTPGKEYELLLEVECLSSLDQVDPLQLFNASCSKFKVKRGKKSVGVDLKKYVKDRCLMNLKQYINIEIEHFSIGYLQFLCKKKCSYKGKAIAVGEVLSFCVTDNWTTFSYYKIINLNFLPNILECMYVFPTKSKYIQIIYDSDIVGLSTSLKEIDYRFVADKNAVHARTYVSILETTQYLAFTSSSHAYERTVIFPFCSNEQDSVPCFIFEIHNPDIVYYICLSEVKCFLIESKNAPIVINEKDSSKIKLMEDGYYIVDKSVSSVYAIPFNGSVSICAVSE